MEKNSSVSLSPVDRTKIFPESVLSLRRSRRSSTRDDEQAYDEFLRKQRVIRYMEEERERAQRTKILRCEHDEWVKLRAQERTERLKFLSEEEIAVLLRKEQEDAEREKKFGLLGNQAQNMRSDEIGEKGRSSLTSGDTTGDFKDVSSLSDKEEIIAQLREEVEVLAEKLNQIRNKECDGCKKATTALQNAFSQLDTEKSKSASLLKEQTNLSAKLNSINGVLNVAAAQKAEKELEAEKMKEVSKSLLAILQNERKTFWATLSTINNDASDTTGDLKDVSSLSDKEEIIAQLREEVEVLAEKLNQIRNKECDGCKKATTALQNAFSQLDTEKSKSASLLKEQTNLSAKLNSINGVLNVAAAQKAEKELEAEKMKEVSKSLLAILQNERQALRATLSTINNEAEASKKKWMKQLTATKAELSSAQDEVRSKHQEYDSMLQRNNSLEREVSRLKNEMSEKSSSIAQLSEENKVLFQKLEQEKEERKKCEEYASKIITSSEVKCDVIRRESQEEIQAIREKYQASEEEYRKDREKQELYIMELQKSCEKLTTQFIAGEGTNDGLLFNMDAPWITKMQALERENWNLKKRIILCDEKLTSYEKSFAENLVKIETKNTAPPSKSSDRGMKPAKTDEKGCCA